MPGFQASRSIAVSCALVLCLWGLRALAGPDSRCNLSVQGRVIDKDVQTPIEGALVSAGPSETITGADGRFLLGDLCKGKITVRVYRDGFSSHEESIRVPAAELLIELQFPMQTVIIRAPSLDDPLTLGFDQILEGDELLRRQGFGLADILEDSSGVTLIQSGAVAKPVIDGFFGNRILIINDGLRHHAQLWALDHAPEIDPFSAGTIAVIRGADGVRYGADAIGGIISVVPMSYPEAPSLTGQFTGVGMSNGQQGLANLGVATRLPFIPQLAVRAQGSVSISGTAQAPDYPLSNLNSEAINGSASAEYRENGWVVSAGFSHVDTAYGVFTGIRGTADGVTDVIEAGEPPNVELYRFDYQIDRPFSTVQHQLARGEIEAPLDFFSGSMKASSLHLRYGYQRNDRKEFEIVRIPVEGAQIEFKLDSHTMEAWLELHPETWLQVSTGVSGLVQSHEHMRRRLIPDYQRTVVGLFALGKAQLTEQWDVGLGARFETQSMSTRQLTSDLQSTVRDELDFQAWMATASLGFTPNEWLKLESHVATATRIPSVDELFVLGLLPGEPFYIEGDNELRPEQTANFGLGASVQWSWGKAEAVGFIHFIQDYIYRGPRLDENGEPDPVEPLIRGEFPALEYRNVDIVQGGGNLGIELGLLSWLRLQTSYALVRARNLSEDTFLNNIPSDRWESSLSAEWTFDGALERLSFSAQHQWVLEQDLVDPEVEFAPPPDGYHLLHASAEADFRVDQQRFLLGIEGQNILDARYRDYLSRLRFFADEPGINVLVRLTVPFDLSLEQRAT